MIWGFCPSIWRAKHRFGRRGNDFSANLLKPQGIWRARDGRAWASRKGRVPHGIEEEGRWGPKRRRFRLQPAGNERCSAFQPGEEFFIDACALSPILCATSFVCMTCPIFSQVTHPYNTCSNPSSPM
jgi:hypothetical protein